MAENTTGKQRGKPFKPGQSGNPLGKPQGAKNRATVMAQALFEGDPERFQQENCEGWASSQIG